MLFRVHLRSGLVVEVDSVEAVLALERGAMAVPAPELPSGSPAPVRHHRQKKVAVQQPSPWAAYCDRIAQPDRIMQRKILALVKEHSPKGITMDELVQATGAKTGASVGGVVSGIGKSAEKYGLVAKQILFRDDDGRFKAGPVLIQNTPPAVDQPS